MKPVLFAAQLCEAVYSGAVPEGLGVIECESIAHRPTCTQGAAYITADEVWIVFAGTNERSDWLSNFRIIKKECFGWFPAHKGFSECAEAVIGQCRKLMTKWAGKRVYVAGHSLGGAVAGLVAVGLQASAKLYGQGNVRLITFGQPRFSTSSNIKAVLQGEYIRVVNGSDVVARVPKLGYTHGGTELYLKNGKGYCIDPDAFEKFIDRATAWQHDRVTDHGMAGYVRALQRIL